ncbi:MAG: hypothetical protein ACR2P1_26275 [Pseudomonadales bacterium]
MRLVNVGLPKRPLLRIVNSIPLQRLQAFFYATAQGYVPAQRVNTFACEIIVTQLFQIVQRMGVGDIVELVASEEVEIAINFWFG